MELPTFFVEMLKSGSMTVSEDNIEQMKIQVKDKRVKVNVTDKKLLKEVMTSARKAATNGSSIRSLPKEASITRVRNWRTLVKEIGEDFRKEGVTVMVTYKGRRAVTVGSDANSKITRVLTGTKSIQIDSALQLAEMIL